MLRTVDAPGASGRFVVVVAVVMFAGCVVGPAVKLLVGVIGFGAST